MSAFSDIAEGYRRLRGKANYGLIYTCNGGWIDLGHMSPVSTRNRYEGAANLWRQAQAGGPDTKIPWAYYYPPQWQRMNYRRSVLDLMRDDSRARFADGSTGFTVRFEMSQGYGSGVTSCYTVRRGLSEAMLKSVALSIFIITSVRFEKLQLSFEYGGVADAVSRIVRNKPYDSGFSQEDLVSNLIGFYIAIGEVTKQQAIDLLHPVGEATAVEVWKRHGAVGENKNKNFQPDLTAITSFDDANEMMCRDDCIGQPRRFPKEFTTVKPAVYGLNFMEAWS